MKVYLWAFFSVCPDRTSFTDLNLILDAEGIMQREDEELDEIINEVKVLAEDAEKPDIYNMDFTSMEPGAGAEDFTRSELRQRIDETSNKLGIHFPTEGEDITRHTGEFDPNDPDIGSVSSQGKVKTLDKALTELRSYHTASEYKPKGPDKSEMQEKMEAKKYQEISRRFAKKGGMLVGPPGTDSGVINHDIDLDDVDIVEGKQQTDQRPLRTRARARARRGRGQGKGHQVMPVHHSARYHGFRRFYDLFLASSLGLPSSVKHVGASLQNSIDKAGKSGARSVAIKKKCDRYSNWAALERALNDDKNK